MHKLFLTIISLGVGLFLIKHLLFNTTEQQYQHNKSHSWSNDFDSYLLYRQIYKKNPKEDIKFVDSELNYRYLIFKSNLEKIKTHNSDKSKNYRLGVNQFTDMTLTELSCKYLDITIKNNLKINKNLEPSPTAVLEVNNEHSPSSNFKKFAPIDWRDHDLFLSSRNQGDCGACWAFASVGTIEALRYKNFNIKKYLSPQQLIDCDNKDKGCKGGWPSIAYNYIYGNGLVSEDNYPYIASTSTCNPLLVEANVESKIDKKVYNCEEDECITYDYQYNLLKNGPMSVVIDAYHTNFFNYESGYYDEDCSEPNHAIILVGVGYDQEKNIQYWIIRNSWGDNWGLNGYGYVKHNLKNNWSCNVNRYAFQPVVIK